MSESDLATLASLAQERAAYLARVRSLLEPQAEAELSELAARAQAAVVAAEAHLADMKAEYRPYAERLARLESRIADAEYEYELPDIENCTNLGLSPG
jgi:hypothetical protein